MDFRKRAEEWYENADADTAGKLKLLDEAQLEESFYTELTFGTAGLRGVLGPGTNRMNAYVVRRATKGLAAYLKTVPGAAERGVVIAYDSRNGSQEFAMEAALVLAREGVQAYLFEGLRAVPQLSFAIRHYHGMAGVVVTASHNPAKYNGYKVYWEHGGQLAPVQADAVLRAIEGIGYFEAEKMDLGAALSSGILRMVGKEVDEAYYAATMSLLLRPALVKDKGADFPIVYTPLFGAGYVPVTTILKRMGMQNIHVVEGQIGPNGDFPGLNAPNPEDKNAFVLAERLAASVHADTILATDPDSDRLGVAVRDNNGSFQVLTGNQIGCLLIEYILASLSETGALPGNGLVVKSVVSTSLADAICRINGVELVSVLTGFRFISEIVDAVQRTGEKTFLFGFEESYGFLAGGFSRDKDAICAAMLVAEACLYYAGRNMNLLDALGAIYKKYGYYKEKVRSYTLEGKAGIEKIADAMAELRKAMPIEPAGKKAVCITDYLNEMPSADMLHILYEGDAWIVVRPSGTEPKLKLYIGASASCEQDVEEELTRMLAEMDQLLTRYLY